LPLHPSYEFLRLQPSQKAVFGKGMQSLPCMKLRRGCHGFRLKKIRRFHFVISLYFSMHKTFLILLLLFQLSSPDAAAENPVDTILNRAERFLRNTSAKGGADDDLNQIISALRPNQQWGDVDYSHEDPSGWKVTVHLQRVRRMALAWTNPTSSLYQDASVKTAIDGALRHWLDKRYQNPNWWHNAIGIPRLMQDIIVLLRRDLTREQFEQAMEVLGQHKVRGTGANLVWSADLGLHYGALSGNVSMIRKCSDLINNEINVSTREGIQPDYSYHQHGPRLQTYHYGGAFLRENIKLAWELRGNPATP
jgi:chondroitin AC lyase